MENRLFATAGAIFFSATAVYALLVYLSNPNYDEREPPAIPHPVPYIGHILSLIRHGQSYFEKVGAKHRLPIFTLQTLNTRTYVITSADLVTAAERNQKTIAFYPFISVLSPRAFDLHPHSHIMDIIKRNLDGRDGEKGLAPELHRAMHLAMAPGPDLDRMNRATLSQMAVYFDEVGAGKDGGEVVVDLFEWIRPRFSIASSDAIYGPGNPLRRQPELQDAFWDFDRGFTMILLGVVPRLLARKAFNGRKKITKALNEYFERGDHKNGLSVVKARYEAGINNGATIDEISRLEIGVLIGVLVNAVPTFFWSLLHVYSNPQLLEDLRGEVAAATNTETSLDGSRKLSIDITTLQDQCPLLLSTFREVLRVRTHNSTSRWATEDTVLNNQYLLKKNSAVIMPGATLHADTKLWGPDANEFNPRRFLKRDAKKGEANLPPNAFRAWGGGQTLCPGRFFATAKITSALAMVLARFEIEPVGGVWVIPEPAGNRLASSIHPPANDVKVRIRSRKMFKDDRWAFGFGGSET